MDSKSAESSIHAKEVSFGDDHSSKICTIIAHSHLFTIPILPAFCIFRLSRPITVVHACTSIKPMTVQHFQKDKRLIWASKFTAARESVGNKQGTLLFDGHCQLPAPMAFYEVYFPKKDVWKWKEIKYPWAGHCHSHTLGIIRV